MSVLQELLVLQVARLLALQYRRHLQENEEQAVIEVKVEGNSIKLRL
jgi:hypothetical protein